MKTTQGQDSGGGISTLKLAIGAASLFLFVVGIKRSFRTDEGKEFLRSGELREPSDRSGRNRSSRNLRAAG
jgi:hypothetical protein